MRDSIKSLMVRGYRRFALHLTHDPESSINLYSLLHHLIEFQGLLSQDVISAEPEELFEDDHISLCSFQRQNKCVASAQPEENALPTHLKVKSFPCFRLEQKTKS